MEACRSSSLSSFFAIVALFSLLVLTTNAEPSSGSDSPTNAEPSSGSDSPKNSTEFIKTSCQVTRYPRLCSDSLLGYVNTIKTSPTELARAAMSVTLANLRSTSAVLSSILARRGLKPREVDATKDCIENISDSVDDLKKSLKEVDYLKGPNFDFHMSNLQTWVSAAMTGEDTCMDGFSGHNMNGNVKMVIRSCVVKDMQLTSIALALINTLSSAQAA
ncbi:hypothetical protein MRB53_025554 [Persea americana]|uniref:Uncharacterized protein n=1 Tax=Persea americana TaxID=3435 RepID=A0ACC2LGI0_PERAE|nr:hypothetical protein MRB53_025554 [Persea americana]